MSHLRLATLADTGRLMQFLNEHWRSGYILAENRELFLYDFADGERLNFGIAENDAGEIIGLFGFMRYNGAPLPDIAGSLWKVRDDVNEPMLGLRLRRFVVANVDHRYFAAPGAGLQTRAIYRMIGMHWIEMDHWYWPNPDVAQPRLSRGTRPVDAPRPSTGASTRLLNDASEIRSFPFGKFAHLGPLKDADYVERRFFRHPIYDYRVFQTSLQGEAVALTVCRVASHDGASVLRIVDYLGDDAHLPGVICHLAALVRDEGHEYLDFICSGFDEQALTATNLQRLDFSRDDVVVPNRFEPFERSNVRVYAVADQHADIRPRLCKADGDQDRPNSNITRTQTGTAEAVNA